MNNPGTGELLMWALRSALSFLTGASKCRGRNSCGKYVDQWVHLRMHCRKIMKMRIIIGGCRNNGNRWASKGRLLTKRVICPRPGTWEIPTRDGV
jgi:hypothetical protein